MSASSKFTIEMQDWELFLRFVLFFFTSIAISTIAYPFD